ncbi:hypothetical protein Tco_1318401 [Tanacetum coccineum]
MSTPVFVDPESSTQADGAQSSRVPVPLPEDPYEAIRQAYLDGTDSESEPFEDPIDTETPKSPLTIAPLIPLSESTPLILVPILRRTARMAVRVPHAISSGLFADLPLWKRYRGTSELVKDSDDEEDEEIKESIDSDSMSEDTEDKGPTEEDEDPATEDKGLTTGVEGPGMDDEGYGLDDESHGIDDEGHSVESDELSLEEEVVPGAPLVQIPPSPEWTSGLLPISPSHSDIPLPILAPMVPLTVPYPIATPTITETEGFLTELRAQVEMQGGLISDHAVQLEELLPALFERYDRDIGELFTRSGRLRRRFSPRGQTDAQRAALWSPKEVRRIYEVWISNLMYITKLGSIGYGTVKGTIGAKMGNGMSECDGEMGSKPDVHSGEGGICTSGAGSGYLGLYMPSEPWSDTQTYVYILPPLMNSCHLCPLRAKRARCNNACGTRTAIRAVLRRMGTKTGGVLSDSGICGAIVRGDLGSGTGTRDALKLRQPGWKLSSSDTTCRIDIP